MRGNKKYEIKIEVRSERLEVKGWMSEIGEWVNFCKRLIIIIYEIPNVIGGRVKES